MKRVSHKTIVNRIKKGCSICPICGCTHSRYYHYNVGYPEIYNETFCSECNTLIGIADNSPYYDVCDIIRESLKHITYKGCVKIAKKFQRAF